MTATSAPTNPATNGSSPTTPREAARRRRAYIAIGCCVAAVAAIIVLAIVLSENVVYFRTVSEAVRSRVATGDARFRIAGKVVPGTVHTTRAGVRFELTDGKATATVLHTGDTPELFKAGAPVVCEGHWDKSKTFDSDRILIKHGSDYTPPKVKVKTKAGGSA
jgi:cytochrome c-type biogenesis protein CcmE